MCVIGTLVRLQLIEFIAINESKFCTTETRSHRENQDFSSLWLRDSVVGF